MRRKIKETMKVMLSIIILFPFSCVAYGQMQPLLGEEGTNLIPSGEPRSYLGKVGVVFASFKPQVSMNKPITKGSAALHGAADGFFSTLAMGAAGPYAAGPAAIAAPFFAIAKAIDGAKKGVSAGKIKEAENALDSYLASFDFQEALRDSLISAAKEQIQYTFVPLDLKGPSAPDEEVNYDVWSYQDIDTVLEVGINSLSLVRNREDINPDLTLRIDGYVRFLSAKEGGEPRNEYVTYRADTTAYFLNWGVDNARLFKREIEHAFQSLVEQILDITFSMQEPTSTDIGMLLNMTAAR
jgi:hypothetical protein